MEHDERLQGCMQLCAIQYTVPAALYCIYVLYSTAHTRLLGPSVAQKGTLGPEPSHPTFFWPQPNLQ